MLKVETFVNSIPYQVGTNDVCKIVSKDGHRYEYVRTFFYVLLASVYCNMDSVHTAQSHYDLGPVL